MKTVVEVLNFTNPVFCAYLTYVCILVLKIMLMAPLTTKQRMKHRAAASPEDTNFANLRGKVKIVEDVERVRRAHLNDLENIPIFFVASFAYILTDPAYAIAIWLFRIFTFSRFIHTFVYAIYVIPQPARGLAWITAYCITGYMAIQTICHFKTF